MQNLQGLLGVALFIALGYALSENRNRVPWKLVGAGLALQGVLAVLLLRAPVITDAFHLVARFVNGVIRASEAGIEFLFGPWLADTSNLPGTVFAIHVLPVIIFFASLMAVLYYLRVLPLIIAGLAAILRKTLGVTGAEATAMAANIFVGQTESPLTIRPLLDRMTRAQLMTLMVGGFATIAGSVLAAYVGLLGGEDDAVRVQFARDLLAASVLSAPAAFVMARLIIPELESPPEEDLKHLTHAQEGDLTNVLDAAARGATDGLKLALNVAAMLIAFVSLLALLNWPLQEFSEWAPIAEWRAERGLPAFTIEVLLGWFLAPVAWCVGVPWSDATTLGSLMGVKLVATEFVAYIQLAEITRADPAEAALSPRSQSIAAYALCGFANFASIAIQIGGLSALAPSRRRDFAQLAVKAMLGGAMASFMTASIAGIAFWSA